MSNTFSDIKTTADLTKVQQNYNNTLDDDVRNIMGGYNLSNSAKSTDFESILFGSTGYNGSAVDQQNLNLFDQQNENNSGERSARAMDAVDSSLGTEGPTNFQPVTATDQNSAKADQDQQMMQSFLPSNLFANTDENFDVQNVASSGLTTSKEKFDLNQPLDDGGLSFLDDANLDLQDEQSPMQTGDPKEMPDDWVKCTDAEVENYDDIYDFVKLSNEMYDDVNIDIFHADGTKKSPEFLCAELASLDVKYYTEGVTKRFQLSFAPHDLTLPDGSQKIVNLPLPSKLKVKYRHYKPMCFEPSYNFLVDDAIENIDLQNPDTTKNYKNLGITMVNLEFKNGQKRWEPLRFVCKPRIIQQDYEAKVGMLRILWHGLGDQTTPWLENGQIAQEDYFLQQSDDAEFEREISNACFLPTDQRYSQSAKNSSDDKLPEDLSDDEDDDSEDYIESDKSEDLPASFDSDEDIEDKVDTAANRVMYGQKTAPQMTKPKNKTTTTTASTRRKKPAPKKKGRANQTKKRTTTVRRKSNTNVVATKMASFSDAANKVLERFLNSGKTPVLPATEAWLQGQMPPAPEESEESESGSYEYEEDDSEDENIDMSNDEGESASQQTDSAEMIVDSPPQQKAVRFNEDVDILQSKSNDTNDAAGDDPTQSASQNSLEEEMLDCSDVSESQRDQIVQMAKENNVALRKTARFKRTAGSSRGKQKTLKELCEEINQVLATTANYAK